MIDEKQCVPLAASKRKGAFVRGATLNTSENRRGKLQNAYDEQHNSLESKRNTVLYSVYLFGGEMGSTRELLSGMWHWRSLLLFTVC